MVSDNLTNVQARSDRGIIAEETIVATSTNLNDFEEYPLPSFWGAIVSGAVVALSIGALSECLMFACRVGTYGNGQISMGAGAGIWLIVTTCVAYFFGGMLASRLSVRGGWMRGLTVWGFTILLLMLVSAFVGGSALPYVHNAQMSEQIVSNSRVTTLYGGASFISYAGVWVGFLILVLSLLFSVIGATFAGTSRTAPTPFVQRKA